MVRRIFFFRENSDFPPSLIRVRHAFYGNLLQADSDRADAYADLTRAFVGFVVLRLK